VAGEAAAAGNATRVGTSYDWFEASYGDNSLALAARQDGLRSWTSPPPFLTALTGLSNPTARITTVRSQTALSRRNSQNRRVKK